MLLLAILLASTAVWAQNRDTTGKGKWSGRAFIGTGYNYSRPFDDEIGSSLNHFQAETRITLKHTKDNFSATVQAGWLQDKNRTALQRIDIKGDQNLSFTSKDNQNKQLRGSVGADLKWSLPRYTVNAYASHNYSRSSLDGTIARISISDDLAILVQEEISYSNLNVSRTGAGLARNIGSGLNTLHFTVDLSHTDNIQTKAWLNTTDGEKINGTCKTPHALKEDVSVASFIRVRNLKNVSSLDAEAGARLAFHHDVDRYKGARLQGEEWIDSLKLREIFKYSTFTVTPYVKGNYRYKFLRIRADYGIQFFGSKLRNNDLTHPYHYNVPAIAGNSEAEFNLSGNHYFAVGISSTVRRPSYTQLCWYDREGDFSDQIIRGDPHLKPAKSFSSRLSYRFKFRKFLSDFSVSYTKNRNELEQTFFKETFAQKEYTIFTWVNSVYSKVWNSSYLVKYENKGLSIMAQTSYYDFSQKAKVSGKVKKDHYWNSMASASYKFRKGWSLSSDIGYRTKVKKAFTEFDNYYILNTRVEKKFKRSSVFLEGTNLLERKLTTTYTSLDEQNFWTETVQNNRRFFVLGYTFDF